MQDNVNKFCETIRNRSMENQIALGLMYSNQLYSNAISILRQELDLMIRTIYVLGVTDNEYRDELMKCFVEGRKWKRPHSQFDVTDRHMVEYAHTLFGYTRLVYMFGCRFVHLSNLQNWLDEDVANNLDDRTKADLVLYINQYHNAGLESDFTFSDIIIFVPDIFDKLHGNLDCYVRDIENGNWGKTD